MFRDVTVLTKALTKAGVRYYIYRDWSKNMTLHNFLHQSERIDIMYDIEQAEAIDGVLDSLKYRVEDCLPEEDEKTLYSEKLGTLRVRGVTILPNGGIVFGDEGDSVVSLDPGFIHDVKRGRVAYPCIFPAAESDPLLEHLQKD